MTKVRIHEKVSSSQFDALDCRLCVKLAYGVVPKGLLTFLRFLGNAEFSPWKRLPDVIKKKSLRVFLRQPVTCCLEKNVCAIPVRVMKDQY